MAEVGEKKKNFLQKIPSPLLHCLGSEITYLLPNTNIQDKKALRRQCPQTHQKQIQGLQNNELNPHFKESSNREFQVIEFRIENLKTHKKASKESACNAGDPGSFPGSGSFPGEGNGNPLQCSCLENPMDRGDCQATVYGVAKVGHD